MSKTISLWERLIDHWRQVGEGNPFPWTALTEENLPSTIEALLEALEQNVRRQQGWIRSMRRTMQQAWKNRNQHANAALNGSLSWLEDQSDRRTNLILVSRDRSSDERWKAEQDRLNAIHPLPRVNREDLWSTRVPRYLSNKRKLWTDFSTVDYLNDLMERTFNENNRDNNNNNVDPVPWMHRIPGFRRAEDYVRSELERKQRWLNLLNSSTENRNREDSQQVNLPSREEEEEETSLLRRRKRRRISPDREVNNNSLDFGVSEYPVREVNDPNENEGKQETEESKQDLNLPSVNLNPYNPVQQVEEEWTVERLLQGPIVEMLGMETIEHLASSNPDLLRDLLSIPFEYQHSGLLLDIQDSLYPRAKGNDRQDPPPPPPPSQGMEFGG